MKYLFTLITMQFYALFYQYSLPGLQKWSYCFSLYSSPNLLTYRMFKSKFHTFKKYIKVNSLSSLLPQNQKQVKELLVSRIKCSILYGVIITSKSQYISRSFFVCKPCISVHQLLSHFPLSQWEEPVPANGRWIRENVLSTNSDNKSCLFISLKLQQ